MLLAKRIPVLIFGLDHKKEDKKRMNKFGMRSRPLWTNKVPSNVSDSDSVTETPKFTISSLISSVYYDNDQHEIYKERSAKEEGAILIRTRWYGSITPTKNIFIERKTHHDKKTTGEASVKERFEIAFQNFEGFVTGELSPETLREEYKKQMSKKKLEEMIELATDVQDAIVQRELHPVVRTTYIRSAFQDQQSNDFRATLDTHLCLSKETDRLQFRNLNEEMIPQGTLITRTTSLTSYRKILISKSDSRIKIYNLRQETCPMDI